MGQLKVSDNAATTLAASLTSSPAATNMTLADASKFPVINHGGSGTDWSYATLYDAANNLEIVKVTRRDNASNILTIVRGTAAGIAGVTDANCRVWASGVTGVACRMTANAFNDIAASADAATVSAAAAAASVAPLNVINGIIKGAGTGAYAAAVPNTDYTQFAAGTRLVFAQASAPAGWTQDTTDAANNRLLRVVSTAGGGSGGSHSPILNNVVPSHTHGFSTGNQSVDHTHYTTTGGASANHTHSIGDPGHAHGVDDPGHSHTYERRPNSHTVGAGGSYLAGISQDAPTTSHAVSGIGIYAAGTGIWTGGFSSDHVHGGVSGGVSANHTHSGSTDNGSSQTNWAPRYSDLIICTKD